ncbi:MAG: ADP-ribosylglycohydrolase family protein, partial [Verrucomicrobiota bacterium]
MTTSAESIPLRNQQQTSVEPISRILGAFWGMWIGDALAMPAHYYRDKDVIKHHYGLLNEYKA